MNENDLIDEAGIASESPLQIMADHLREIGQGIVLSSGIIHGEIELQVNAGTVAQLLMLVRDDRQACRSSRTNINNCATVPAFTCNSISP